MSPQLSHLPEEHEFRDAIAREFDSLEIAGFGKDTAQPWQVRYLSDWAAVRIRFHVPERMIGVELGAPGLARETGQSIDLHVLEKFLDSTGEHLDEKAMFESVEELARNRYQAFERVAQPLLVGSHEFMDIARVVADRVGRQYTDSLNASALRVRLEKAATTGAKQQFLHDFRRLLEIHSCEISDEEIRRAWAWMGDYPSDHKPVSESNTQP